MHGFDIHNLLAVQNLVLNYIQVILLLLVLVFDRKR